MVYQHEGPGAHQTTRTFASEKPDYSPKPPGTELEYPLLPFAAGIARAAKTR